MENELLYKLLEPFSSENDLNSAEKMQEIAKNPLSKVDFYLDGLSGGEGSVAKRDALAAKFGLPDGMTANALLSALRLLCTYEEYCRAVGREKE